MAAQKRNIDMTQGNIAAQVMMFAIPLLIGDILQQLYNTCDSMIVGNFLGKQALASVGSTGNVVNILVGLFIGISTGATVIISRRFGAKDKEGLIIAVRTTVWLTLFMGIAFTVIGIAMTPYVLKIMNTPPDVMPMAIEYLRVYFAGISGLIMYNMCSGILRAVGDSRRPLYILLFSSVLNIVLDLLFIIPLNMGVAGAAYATIISQFISAGILIYLLEHTEDFMPLELQRFTMDKKVLGVIFGVGLPFGLQRSITAFSNTVVVSYINKFGSGATAGWSAQNKIDHIVFKTLQSMSAAVTTFVSQNVGAKKPDRIKKGIYVTLLLTIGICLTYAITFVTFRRQLIGLFNRDEEVIYYGSIALMILPCAHIINCFVQIKSGVMRGYGNGKAPMFISLICYVFIRQIYLHVGWPFFQSFPFVVSAFPFTWAICICIMTLYEKFAPGYKRMQQQAEAE